MRQWHRPKPNSNYHWRIRAQGYRYEACCSVSDMPGCLDVHGDDWVMLYAQNQGYNMVWFLDEVWTRDAEGKACKKEDQCGPYIDLSGGIEFQNVTNAEGGLPNSCEFENIHF